MLGGIWGTSFLFIKVALEGLPPLYVSLARCAAGAAVMLAAVAVGRLRLPRQLLLWRQLLVLALLTNVIPFTLFAWGQERVSSSVAGIYNGTTPLMTLLVALALVSDERPTAERIAGLLLGFLGVVVVLGPWHGVGSNTVAGQLACLAASGCYGLGFHYTRRVFQGRGLSPVELTAGQMLLSTALLAVAAPIGGGEVTVTWRVAAAVGALGAFGTGIAYVIYHGLVRDVGAMTTSLVTFIVPVVAVFLGVVVLDEPLTWNLFAGGVVVFAGVAVAEGRLRRSRRRGDLPALEAPPPSAA